jgi:hypothetical protein
MGIIGLPGALAGAILKIASLNGGIGRTANFLAEWALFSFF